MKRSLASELQDVVVAQVEQNMTAPTPRSRWRTLSRVSPSGKQLFVCLSCGQVNIAPTATCLEPIKMWNGTTRECKDWQPSPFEVQ